MKTHASARLIEELLDNIKFADFMKDSDREKELTLLLSNLKKLLQQAPNMEIEETKLMRKTDNLAVNLKSLISLSKYTKQQWVSLIKEFDLKIELNPRASSRDVLGKVLNYLEEHPEILKSFSAKSKSKRSGSDLEDTLSKLISYKS